VFHHSTRVFLFGSLMGRHRGLGFDPELLYIGAMFHDLGLGPQFRGSGQRFEVDSAGEARAFPQSHGVPEDSVRRVWTAIALHTTPGIPQFMEPEVVLVTAGVEYDVLGIGCHDISDAARAEILALHWQLTDDLSRRCPGIDVETDPLFVRDGPVITSAGATAGITAWTRWPAWSASARAT
jgi:hypothetical protein